MFVALLRGVNVGGGPGGALLGGALGAGYCSGAINGLGNQFQNGLDGL